MWAKAGLQGLYLLCLVTGSTWQHFCHLEELSPTFFSCTIFEV